MQIAEKKVVSIHYTLTDDGGKVLDSSDGGDPLAYIHGAGNIIPGLENALIGKQAGDKLNVTIPPAEAYGERNDALTQVVPVSAFEGVDKIEEGMQFHAQAENGEPVTVTIAKVEGDDVTVDGNHPLAGQALTFDVEVAEVREATDEELDHGHAHGPGGHHHD